MAPLAVFARASDFDPVYYGHEGVRAFWRQWFASWEGPDFEYEEFIDAGACCHPARTIASHGKRNCGCWRVSSPE